MCERQTDPFKKLFEERNDELAKIVGTELKPVVYDKHYKRRMNRFFRFVGCKTIPYPDVDNLYERIAAKLMIFKYKLFS